MLTMKAKLLRKARKRVRLVGPDKGKATPLCKNVTLLLNRPCLNKFVVASTTSYERGIILKRMWIKIMAKELNAKSQLWHFFH